MPTFRGIATRLGLVSRVPEILVQSPDPRLDQLSSPVVDADERYLAFQALFHDPETVARLQANYLEYIVPSSPGAGALHVDIGAGRGEFAELARSAGLEVLAVEPNASEARSLRARGFRAEEADANSALEALEPGSVGSITCLQVIEHMQPEYFLEFVDLATRCLGPGGTIVIETVNWACMPAHENFYLDLSHARPYPHQTVAFHMAASGLTVERLVLSVPIGPDRWVAKRHDSRYWNYALVGRKPPRSAL